MDKCGFQSVFLLLTLWNIKITCYHIFITVWLPHPLITNPQIVSKRWKCKLDTTAHVLWVKQLLHSRATQSSLVSSDALGLTIIWIPFRLQHFKSCCKSGYFNVNVDPFGYLEEVRVLLLNLLFVHVSHTRLVSPNKKDEWMCQLSWDEEKGEAMWRYEEVKRAERTGKTKRTSERRCEERHWRLRSYRALQLIWQPPLKQHHAGSIVSQDIILNHICICQHCFYCLYGSYPWSKVWRCFPASGCISNVLGKTWPQGNIH